MLPLFIGIVYILIALSLIVSMITGIVLGFTTHICMGLLMLVIPPFATATGLIYFMTGTSLPAVILEFLKSI